MTRSGVVTTAELMANATGGPRAAGRGIAGAPDPALVEDLEQATADACAGDVSAFRILYAELAPAVGGYLRVRGAEDPDAGTNEVFLALLGQLSEVQGGWDGFRSLAFAIAHVLVIDELGRRSQRPRLVEFGSVEDSRTSGSTEQQALDRLEGRGTLELLRLLPTDQQSVVALRVLADLSVRQTSEVMGRSPAGVRKLQDKALATLRALLAGPDAEEPKL